MEREPIHNASDTSEMQEHIRQNYLNQFKKEIMTDVIIPYNRKTLEDMIKNKVFYAKLLQIFIVMQIFFASFVVPALILSAKQFDGKYYLEYISAIVSFMVGCLQGLNTMIIKGNKSRTERINTMMRMLNIKYTDVDITIGETTQKIETPNDDKIVIDDKKKTEIKEIEV